MSIGALVSDKNGRGVLSFRVPGLHARFAGSRRAIARVRRVLLHAVLEASEACGRGGEKLAWATASREKSQQIAAQFGFAVAVRPSNTDCELTYYLERTFPAVN